MSIIIFSIIIIIIIINYFIKWSVDCRQSKVVLVRWNDRWNSGHGIHQNVHLTVQLERW